MFRLKPKESILRREKALCKSGPGLIRTGGIYQEKYRPMKGLLVLTTSRLVFQYEEGFFSKRRGTLVEVPTSLIHNVFVARSLLSSKLLVEYRSFGKLLQSSFEVHSPEAWASTIQEALRRLTSSEEDDDMKPRRPLVKQEKIVIIREKVKIRCRHCGTLVETADRCPYCGASL